MATAKAPAGHTLVTDIDDKTAVCRGDSHDWPKFRIGVVPRGIRYVPVPGTGVHEIRQTCKLCGRIRWRLTVPYSAAPDFTSRWQYKGGPRDFSAIPGSNYTKADYQVELGRRLKESIHLFDVPEES